MTTNNLFTKLINGLGFITVKNMFIGLCVSSLLLTNAFAGTKPIKITEGKDYTLLSVPVQKTAEPKGKVNVKEFFMFTCPHCKDVDPFVEKQLFSNKSIDLNKIHVVWDEKSSPGFAKLNATLELMKLHKLYAPAFAAYEAKQDLNNVDTLKKFLAKNGLKPEEITKFMATYNSFTIVSKVSEYKVLTSKYNITGTPSFIVGDRYVVSPAKPEQSMRVIEALVQKVNSEK